MAVRRRPSRGAPGRHFLRSSRLAAALVAEAGIARGDLVVEVGGGTGVITRELARAGADIVVVELDPALTGGLRRRFGDVEIVEADAAEYAWPSEAFAVVANLPFARSGAILARLLGDPCVPLRHAHVIVQWEFAVKHAAVWPSTLRSTYWRAWYDVATMRRLARTAFSPPPSVDAAVLRFERRVVPLVAAGLHERYRRFLSRAFAARSLRAVVSPLEVKRLAPVLGFSPDAFPWELDAVQWARLFELAGRRAR